ARRKIRIPVEAGGVARITGVTGECQGRWSVGINTALRPRCKGSRIEVQKITILRIDGQGWLPADTGINGQARRRFPRVLHIEAEVIQAVVTQRCAALRQRGWTADHEVRERHTGDLSIEREGTGRIELRHAVKLSVNPVRAISDLVPAPDHAHV